MTSFPKNTKMSIGQWLMHVLHGALIGVGAILPGVSGGVMCVLFGIYQPMMALLSHPGKAFRQYPSRWARLLEWVDPRGRPRHALRWVLRGVTVAVARCQVADIVGVAGPT